MIFWQVMDEADRILNMDFEQEVSLYELPIFLPFFWIFSGIIYKNHEQSYYEPFFYSICLLI